MNEDLLVPQTEWQNNETDDLNVPQTIRSETVLSRYPVHWIEKVKNAQKYQVTGIEVIEKDSQGIPYPVWQVTYNAGYGAAGILAYKLDTLVVNRRIDEARQPEIPALIKLGSLREIAREVGVGDSHTASVKKALYQNAFAAVVTKQTYIGRDGTRQTFEFGDTRYGVFLFGQELPNGKKADAVYISLHEGYRALLNSARTRPLDYDYLKTLAPSAQRFYELLSFQIFGALKHNRPQARLLYSDYCSHAPQTRYDQYKRMHRQMKEIQEPHLASGYLAEVEYQEITDDEGNPDWEILYTPGELAREHYQAANAKGKQVAAPRARKIVRETVKALPPPPPAPASEPIRSEAVASEPVASEPVASEPVDSEPNPVPAPVSPPVPPPVAAYDKALVAELVSHGLTNEIAARLAIEKPEACRKQLDLLPFQTITKSKAGFLRRAIESPDGYGIPAEYEKKQEEKAQGVQQNASKSRQEALRGALVAALVQLAETLISGHAEALTDFLAFFKAEQSRDLSKFPKTGRMYRAMAELYDGEQKQLELIVTFYADHPCPLPELGAFIQTHRPERLKPLIRAHFEAQSKSGQPT